jgi:ComF family protein
MYCDNICTESICEVCDKIIKEKFCAKIIKTHYREVICASAFAYQGCVKEAIKRFKFKHEKSYKDEFSKLVAKTVKKCFPKQKFDLITCVPIHENRVNTRGYNQSELIARGVSKILGISFENTLIKTQNNRSQHGLNFAKRQTNVDGVYKLIKNLDGKKILICDDIITTGATLNECITTLFRAKADVFCACLAYTEK